MTDGMTRTGDLADELAASARRKELFAAGERQDAEDRAAVESGDYTAIQYFRFKAMEAFRRYNAAYQVLAERDFDALLEFIEAKRELSRAQYLIRVSRGEES